MTAYTDEDVQRLVEVGRLLIEQRDGWNEPHMEWVRKAANPIVWSGFGDLEIALEPFQSDPDADLIEAMAQGMRESVGPWVNTWDETDDASRDDWIRQARAALAAYRKHTGETNDPH